jgi:hypothetical protein
VSADELTRVLTREGEEDLIDELDGGGRPFDVEQDGTRRRFCHKSTQDQLAPIWVGM